MFHILIILYFLATIKKELIEEHKIHMNLFP